MKNSNPSPPFSSVMPLSRGMSLSMPSAPPQSLMTIQEVPDMVLLKIFSFLRVPDLCKIMRVCRRWRLLACDPQLWQTINLRPDYNGIQISSVDTLMRLITTRFGSSLRYLELPCDLITVPVLESLSSEAPQLRFLTLDFSNAMQLHDFNDLGGFPSNLYYLCVCLSDVIFMEGLMRKIYQALSTLEVLHLVGKRQSERKFCSLSC